jgi:hypothetical protein
MEISVPFLLFYIIETLIELWYFMDDPYVLRASRSDLINGSTFIGSLGGMNKAHPV